MAFRFIEIKMGMDYSMNSSTPPSLN
jgi:hypothetical protein